MAQSEGKTIETVLLIDTCGAAGSVALFRAGLLVAKSVLADRSASVLLLSAVSGVLSGVRQPDAVTVVNGPGSFTGVRVGLSAAKALAEAWNVPLFAVSRLEVLGEGSATGLAVMDAGRGQLYVRDLATGMESLEDRATVLEHIAESALPVVAEAALAATLPNAAVREVHVGDAWSAVQRAIERGAEDIALLDANYVRSESDIYGARKSA
ncbi:MAG: tRNA (adenosine(37)-N6)-threonylcarbamoyltransferase complex dimerization subunit type 1 TsaB [Acidobacteriaceae bacterium]|nr:tRNA (adenosine(37)-N6)-threonylcarbamoyltransferase complex dimerization subunit type 1 TsaB [Acidobacteriaceae bacterium]